MLDALRRISWPERATPYMIGALIGGLAFAVFNMSSPSPCNTASAQALCPVANSSVFSGTYALQSGSAFTVTVDMASDPTVDYDLSIPTDDTDDVFVLEDSAQTLTVKTLTSPTITTSPTAAGSTWSDLGSVSTVDINAGTIDGVTVGGSSAAGGTFTTLNATGGGELTGAWTDLGSVSTVDINGGTIDGTIIGGSSTSSIGATSITGSGVLSIDNTTDSTSVITGSIHTDGGLGVAKDIVFGGGLISGTAETTVQTTAGSLVLDPDSGYIVARDNKSIGFGNGNSTTDPDYWFNYTTASSQLRLRGTDVDGGGGNGNVFEIDSGTNDVTFNGGISADGAAVATTGITLDSTITFDADTADPVGSETFINRSTSGTGRLHYNVASGNEHNFLINGTEEYAMSASSFSFGVTNDLTNIGSNITCAAACSLNTDAGHLTVEAAAGSDVLIGDGTTYITVDGGLDGVGIGGSNNIDTMLVVHPTATTVGSSTTTSLEIKSGTVTIDGALSTGRTLDIQQITYTAGSALAVTSPSSVHIAGAPIAAGSATFTNGPYALWVDDGISRFDDDLDFRMANQDYLLTSRGNWLAIQGQDTGVNSIVELFSFDGDLDSDVQLSVWGQGTPDDASLTDKMSFKFDAGHDRFEIVVESETATNELDLVFLEGTDSWLTKTGAGNATFNSGNNVIFTDGLMIGADSSTRHFDDSSHGGSSTTMYIGDETIDTTVSDRRKKRDITPLASIDAGEWLRGAGDLLREFEWRSPDRQHYGMGRNLGFIAQEFVDYAPQLTIDGGEFSTWSVKYGHMTPYLIAGWNDHDTRIESLEARIDTLESRLAALEAAA